MEADSLAVALRADEAATDLAATAAMVYSRCLTIVCADDKCRVSYTGI